MYQWVCPSDRQIVTLLPTVQLHVVNAPYNRVKRASANRSGERYYIRPPLRMS